MSEIFVASARVNARQNRSALVDIVASAFRVAARDIASLFDFSVPAYSTEDLVGRCLSQSIRQLTSLHTVNLMSQFPCLPQPFAHTMANTQALLESIQNQPILRLGAERLRANEWMKAQSLLATAQKQLRKADVNDALCSVRQAQSLLKSVLKDVQTHLYRAQHEFVVSSVKKSLEELGYQVKSARSAIGSWTALWATKGGNAIGVVVSPQSRITLDMLGWEGTSCQAELYAFCQKMEEKGIHFQEGKRYLHGRRDGGILLQNAAKLARSKGLSIPEALLEISQKDPQNEQRRRQATAILLSQGRGIRL